MTTATPDKVVFVESAMSVITDEARASTDGLETGGILLGQAEANAVIIRHAGGPGPGAVRRPDFFQRDLQLAQSLADRAFALDHSVWVGEWHTHIHAPPRPSITDLLTYRTLLSDTELAFDYFVAIILADDTNGWLSPRLTVWMIISTHPGSIRARRVPTSEVKDR